MEKHEEERNKKVTKASWDSRFQKCIVVKFFIAEKLWFVFNSTCPKVQYFSVKGIMKCESWRSEGMALYETVQAGFKADPD